jgi:hypothetical protein
MHRFEFAVPLGVRALVEVRCRLADWLERNGLADPARANLVLATHESIANAIEHAHATKPCWYRQNAATHTSSLRSLTTVAGKRKRNRHRIVALASR